MSEQSHHDNIECVYNFRDVGKVVNEHIGRKLIREGLFYRSAKPDNASSSDQQIIKHDIGIRTVIDLRTDTEHQAQAKRRDKIFATTGKLRPLHIDGLNYFSVKITGRKFERLLLSQLTWLSFFKFFYLFLLGYRFDAISIIGREVMLPKGLIGLNHDTLDCSRSEIKEALMLYTSQENVPCLVHCTQGKDRTGLICALVLMILDVPVPTIEHDYFLSDEGLASDYEQRLKEIKSIGLTSEWATTDKRFVTSMVAYLTDHYGGVDGYLDSIGFDKIQRNKVRHLLLY